MIDEPEAAEAEAERGNRREGERPFANAAGSRPENVRKPA
jgi:hypothetical protein